jgi:hypothetical protein
VTIGPGPAQRQGLGHAPRPGGGGGAGGRGDCESWSLGRATVTRRRSAGAGPKAGHERGTLTRTGDLPAAARDSPLTQGASAAHCQWHERRARSRVSEFKFKLPERCSAPAPQA